ncbi:MAG TPA: hypothetical protein VEK73_02360, partial [Xanthobacteraceae bacterium]|nr:hypothetical protein [Xanthobacteraceae bacterium]
RVRSDAGILSIGVLLRQRPAANRTSWIRQSGDGAPQPFFQQFYDITNFFTHLQPKLGSHSLSEGNQSVQGFMPSKLMEHDSA